MLEKLANFSNNPEKIGKRFFRNWQILVINQEKLAKSLEKLANFSDKPEKIGKI